MGWIKIDRRIVDNAFLWAGEPFSKGQAWIDLLLLASYEESEVPRGCIRTSVRSLSARWNWSVKRVFNYLKTLEGKQMVRKKCNTMETLITIVNYDKYQVCGNTLETQRKHDGNTAKKKEIEEAEKEEKKQKKNKGEEEKKENKNKKKEDIYNNPPTLLTKSIPPSLQDVITYVDEKHYTDVDPHQFYDFYESKGWMVGKSKMKDWQAALRGWHSRNGKGGHGLADRGRGASFFDLLAEDEL